MIKQRHREVELRKSLYNEPERHHRVSTDGVGMW